MSLRAELILCAMSFNLANTISISKMQLLTFKSDAGRPLTFFFYTLNGDPRPSRLQRNCDLSPSSYNEKYGASLAFFNGILCSSCPPRNYATFRPLKVQREADIFFNGTNDRPNRHKKATSIA